MLLIYLTVINILILISIYLNYIKFNNYDSKISPVYILLPTIFSVMVLTFNAIDEEPFDKNYLEELNAEMIYKLGGSEKLILRHKDGDAGIPLKTYEFFKETWNGETWDGDPYHSLVYTKIKEGSINQFNNVIDNHAVIEKSDSLIFDRNSSFTKSVIGGFYEPRQDLIYGVPNRADSISRYISWISSKNINFRPSILVWKDVDEKDANKLVKLQRDFWNNGNYNDVIFCVSIDSKTDEILWSRSFSWDSRKVFEDFILNFALAKGNILNLNRYAEGLYRGYENKLWSPKKPNTALNTTFSTNSMIHLLVMIVNIILVFIIYWKRFKLDINRKSH